MFRVVLGVVLSGWQLLWGRITIRAVKESTVEQLAQIARHALAHLRVVVFRCLTPVFPHTMFLSQAPGNCQSDHTINVLVLERRVTQRRVAACPLLRLLVVLPQVGFPVLRLRRAQVYVSIGLLARKAKQSQQRRAFGNNVGNRGGRASSG